MEQQHAHYNKGFNNGYLLAKFEPRLLDKLLKQISPSGGYLEGLFSGKDEYELEYNRAQLNELSHLRNEFKERDRDLEK